METPMTEAPIQKETPITPQRELLTARDVAARLSIGVSTLWRQVKRGNLPAPIRIGGSTRWRRADIEALTAAQPAA
jgi:excisionase family DNA binding protein